MTSIHNLQIATWQLLELQRLHILGFAVTDALGKAQEFATAILQGLLLRLQVVCLQGHCHVDFLAFYDLHVLIKFYDRYLGAFQGFGVKESAPVDMIWTGPPVHHLAPWRQHQDKASTLTIEFCSALRIQCLVHLCNHPTGSGVHLALQVEALAILGIVEDKARRCGFACAASCALAISSFASLTLRFWRWFLSTFAGSDAHCKLDFVL
mmetsp:Transcript_51951/g.82948  ORF Transcript_51951/g.82948 Transcript_51951/m.82948 type:complete len:209 (-) Transcript_51951:172-798(-)